MVTSIHAQSGSRKGPERKVLFDEIQKTIKQRDLPFIGGIDANQPKPAFNNNSGLSVGQAKEKFTKARAPGSVQKEKVNKYSSDNVDQIAYSTDKFKLRGKLRAIPE